jgi:hypothetical protein
LNLPAASRLPSRAVDQPLDLYRVRLSARREAVRRLAARDATIASARLVTFIAAGVLAWLALRGGRVAAIWLALPGAIFLGLVLAHDRVIRGLRRAERAVQLYEVGIARVQDRWPVGDGRSGRFQEDAHPYAADLDLFGRGSLFERLSTARTSMGEETLASWLNTPAPAPVIRQRQRAVDELRPALDLKEDLALLGMEVRTDVNPLALAAWAAAPHSVLPAGPLYRLPTARAATALLGLVNLSTLLAWLTGHLGPLPFLVSLAVSLLYVWPARGLVRSVVGGVDRRAGELKILALVLRRLERERFQAPALVALRIALDSGGHPGGARALPPSRRIGRLALLVDLLEARHNQLFAVLALPLLWTTQLALAVDEWRRAFGPAVGRWLQAVGEIEALTSLATFAFEHPQLPFPTIAEGAAGSTSAAAPLFDAEAIVHPLLPLATSVPNDVVLGGAATADGGATARLLMVSGSNMSGKSTMLRTIGVNAVLALAGAPVCARRLTLAPMAIGASLRLHDSIQEGRSRFFAEITRLRQIVDLTAGPLPVLFLLDEVLSGTNSHDRRIGAEAVIRTLLARGAIGLATTHDLALAEIAGGLGATAANVHFEDHLEAGTIRFDYLMRPGVIRKSNALALMRAVGLDVVE